MTPVFSLVYNDFYLFPLPGKPRKTEVPYLIFRKDLVMTSLLLIIIYLAFISLGLPDALLGSAWPSMYRELGASVSWAGIISMIISAGTIISSFASDWLTRK